VLTTHYLDEAERLCDRIGVMHAGEIVALDTPIALLAAVGAQVLEVRLERELDSGPLLAGLRGEGVAGADAFVVGTTVIVPLHNGSASGVTDAVARLGVLTTAMVTRRPTLDDVYLRLTGDRIAA
jgi:ABC-2 type transport system ATP-binding protein